MTRLLSHPLFGPVLALAALSWGTALAVFLLAAPVLGSPWVDTLLVFCFGFDSAARVYRLDTLILYLLQPPLFVTAIGLFYGDEIRQFARGRAGKTLAGAVSLAFVLASGVVVASSQVSAGGTPLRPESVQAPLRQGVRAPEFTLTDHQGRPLALADERGKVVAMTFFYASCHATCPTLLSRLRLLEDRFPGEDLVLVGITLDPSRDGVAELDAHARRWSLGSRWRLLTGAPLAVEVVRKAYGVQAAPLPGGEIAHENVIHLVDRRGRLAYVFRGLGYPEEQLVRGVRALVEERG